MLRLQILREPADMSVSQRQRSADSEPTPGKEPPATQVNWMSPTLAPLNAAVHSPSCAGDC